MEQNEILVDCNCHYKARCYELNSQLQSVTAITNLCQYMKNFIDIEYKNYRFFVMEGMDLVAPFYLQAIGQLVIKLVGLLRIFNMFQPHVSQYKSKIEWIHELNNKSNNRHVDNIDEIVKYKCLGDDDMIEQFKQLIVETWGNKKDENNPDLPMVSPWDTDLLQKLLLVTDKRFRAFKIELNFLTRRVVFASERQVGYLRELYRILTGIPFLNNLQRSKGRGKIRSIADQKKEDEYKNFLCFFMNDLEALALCVDADINKNEFFIPKIMGDERTIFSQLAGDKQSKYGYGESIATLTNKSNPLSAHRSIPTILIIGDFADERVSHLSTLQKMKQTYGYDKQYICGGLTDWPVIVSTVIYSYDKNCKITSRFSYSAVAIWDQNITKSTGRAVDAYDERKHIKVDHDVVKLQNDFDHIKRQQNQNKKRKNSNKSTWKDAFSKCNIAKIFFFNFVINKI